MTRLLLIATVVALLAGAGAAFATAGSTRPAAANDFSSCIKKARSTAAAEACISAEFKRISGVMNSAYNRLLATTGVDKAKLKSAQAKWVSFRDADCAFAGSINAGGTLGPIDVGECKIELTTERATELQNYRKQLHP
ncbi:MAG TPA: lysozyme inhibitor LprI family protein [Gaiellaceae bacterium]|nr:lysozyme inhibitor LprI family protein [Gaiellaceae bacterium]